MLCVCLTPPFSSIGIYISLYIIIILCGISYGLCRVLRSIFVVGCSMNGSFPRPSPPLLKCGGARTRMYFLSPSRLSYFKTLFGLVSCCAVLCHAMPCYGFVLLGCAAPPFVVVLWWLGGRGPRDRAVQVKGPFPKFDYSPNVKKEIGMIAGGTGKFE